MIATCLVSSSSSFVLMPSTSSSRVSINRQLDGRPTSVCNNKSTLIKLTAVRSSGRSDTSTNNERSISQMTLPQILQLLNRLNIRYPPDAARSELEDLLYKHYKSSNQPVKSSKSPPSSTSTSSVQSNGQNIVDAVVLDDDKSVQDEEYYQQDQIERGSAHHRRTQQSQSRQRRQGRTTSGPNNRTSDGNSTHRAEYRAKSNQYRPRRRRENYDLYNNYYNPTTTSNRARRNDVIDLDTFDLPDDPNNRNEYYDNGAQIFLMGFLEAGKTATQLALDSVAEAVNPFSGEKRWYDEERGHEVLDVNVLDYSPDYGRRSQPQRRYSSESGRRRRRRRRRAGRPGRSYSVTANNIPSQRRQRVVRQPTSSASDSLEKPATFAVATDSSGNNAIDGNSVSNYTSNMTGIEQRVRSRNERSRQDDTKPIYGLYNGDISDRPSPNNLNNVTGQRQETQPHRKKPTHPKKTWKKRLRKKFDAALGLQSSSSSSSSSESLYDSWKTQVGAVNDGRKEALRNEMDNKNSSTGPSTNNRRSRMRAKLNSGQISKTAKSYLDEPPFWRKDGGTIASVLFDSEQPPSPSRRGGVDPRLKRKYNNSLDTLEALLRSPLGRQNTVTSLVIFVARSSLSWFGSLCRWAGVRGTIPQPIVVTTVFAMGISSRRGYRTLSLCLSLLALRMVGEFLHGSLHGNEFWEDDYNKETHEWTQE